LLLEPRYPCGEFIDGTLLGHLGCECGALIAIKTVGLFRHGYHLALNTHKRFPHSIEAAVDSFEALVDALGEMLYQ
jgi:hypothetical protein